MEAREVLPIDCWQSIFSHLDHDGLEAVSLVCKDFLAITNFLKHSLRVIHPRVGMLSAHLKRFRKLKKIDLREFVGDIDEVIREISRSGLRTLQALDISSESETEITTESLIELGSNSKTKNLKVFNFFSVRNLQDENLAVEIADLFPNLEEVKIGYIYYFWSEIPTDYDAILASKFKHLKKIHISEEHFVSDQSLVALSLNCLFLKEVRISCHQHKVTANGIDLLLWNRPNLEAQSIEYIFMNNSSQSTITIENSINHARALISLEFSMMDVSDTLLNAIANAKLPLKKFHLDYCDQFTVAGYYFRFYVITSSLS